MSVDFVLILTSALGDPSHWKRDRDASIRDYSFLAIKPSTIRSGANGYNGQNYIYKGIERHNRQDIRIP